MGQGLHYKHDIFANSSIVHLASNKRRRNGDTESDRDFVQEQKIRVFDYDFL